MMDATNDSRVISYRAIRKAIGIIGLLLPIALIEGKMYYFHDPGIQGSISSYYYTGMRDVLVGSLWAIGVFLFSYRGYDAPEGPRLRRLLDRPRTSLQAAWQVSARSASRSFRLSPPLPPSLD